MSIQAVALDSYFFYQAPDLLGTHSRAATTLCDLTMSTSRPQMYELHDEQGSESNQSSTLLDTIPPVSTVNVLRSKICGFFYHSRELKPKGGGNPSGSMS